MYIYHIFFIYLSVSGHLSCLHVLAVINSVAMNAGVHVCILEVCLDICPGVRLLDRMAALFLVIWGTSMLFSIVAALAYIPTDSVWGFSFLYPVKELLSEGSLLACLHCHMYASSISSCAFVYCTVLYRVQYLCFKPRMSRSKHKSSSDVPDMVLPRHL